MEIPRLTALGVLSEVLGRDGQQLSASQKWNQALADADRLARLHAIWTAQTVAAQMVNLRHAVAGYGRIAFCTGIIRGTRYPVSPGGEFPRWAQERRPRKRGPIRCRQVKIGAPDPSLTPNGGMLAVRELCDRLGLIVALDEAIGPVKQRRRGFTGGQVLAGMAAAQLAGEDFLVGLDRLRADKAGQQVTLVAGLAASSAGQVARRFTPEHWRGAERGLATATARMLGLLPAERAAELAGGGPVTIDIDATDVEVYGSKKQGVAYNYQGQRAGRPHVAAWAETEIPLAADLLAGDSDPRSHVVTLLGRALAALPQQVRDGAKAAGRKIALRADAGYFAGDLARAAIKHEMEFAIGAKRISSMWRALAGIDEDAWRDAIDMPGAQVAVSPYKPAGWPSDTVLLIRRVRLDPDQVSADPRSRRRRTLDPRQRALPIGAPPTFRTADPLGSSAGKDQ